MTIDAYSHCGIAKYSPVEEVLKVMIEAHVNKSVLCQHLGEYDNAYLANVVRQYPLKFAAVCLVNTESPEASEDLRRWHSTGCFRGLRVLTSALESSKSLCLEALDLGMNLVIYGPDGITNFLSVIGSIAQHQHKSQIIISHLGNPILEDDQIVAGQEIFQLASESGILVQLSGLSMFCNYPHEPLTEFIQEMVHRFTPERILWGSNFPVCGDKAAYIRDLNMVVSGPWGLTPQEVEWITVKTAEKVWFD